MCPVQVAPVVADRAPVIEVHQGNETGVDRENGPMAAIMSEMLGLHEEKEIAQETLVAIPPSGSTMI